MKTYTATHDKRPTKLAGLLAKLNAFRQTPAWVKTRRFFWAVGVVLLEAFMALMSVVAAASKNNGNAGNDEDSDEISYKSPQNGVWRNKHGNYVCGNIHAKDRRL
ncbi:MAG: hypothetical protein N0C88_01570 [Candidatus Thiodiazotropha lotti]|uniref:Uncharacterized protein n=1 Tax=Candidatus Thiodiazotropha lotti TaxID=2792787 RepID=A0A9E4K2E7_9GAMM|nr:hypothetical protein [Candidatus Thiodiazotropha lotti]MCW4201996.1 hypothetical protein [Candidatus Thiodiazotropha lotti]